MVLAKKRCSKCGELIPLNKFGKSRSNKDGLQYWCKACRATYRQANSKKLAAYYRQWREENPDYTKRYNNAHREEIAAYNKLQREKNTDKIAVYNKQYRAENAEKIAASKKEYYDSHREQAAAKCKQYYENNRDKRAAYNKLWRDENPRKNAAIKKRWAQSHPEKCADYKHIRRARKVAATIEDFDIREIWERDDEVCTYCGATENLSIDHIVPLSGGGAHSPDNLCIACKSCNSSKGAKTLAEWQKEI